MDYTATGMRVLISILVGLAYGFCLWFASSVINVKRRELLKSVIIGLPIGAIASYGSGIILYTFLRNVWDGPFGLFLVAYLGILTVISAVTIIPLKYVLRAPWSASFLTWLVGGILTIVAVAILSVVFVVAGFFF